MIDVLVIGGESLIGESVIQRLLDSGLDVLATTRRIPPGNPKWIHLDLVAPYDEWPELPKARAWIICAAESRLWACRKDTITSTRVNVDAPVALARLGFKSGTHIVFLSTNQVFNGDTAHLLPTDPVSPATVYGQQKADAENQIAALKGRHAILRLTKVIEPKSALFCDWIERLKRGETIQPFEDMVFSPVPLTIVSDILTRLIEPESQGIYQASAPQDISYEDAARHIAASLGASQNLIAVASAAARVPVAEILRHTTLDPKRITDDFKLAFPGAYEALDATFSLSPPSIVPET